MPLVVIDMETSTSTDGMTGRKRAAGELFDHSWLLDGAGTPTRDPNAFWADPPGTLLPLGGLEAGHKGFALGLLVEALTSGLAGVGRAEQPTGWGASVLVLVLDPQKFGGAEAFIRESGWMAEAVRSNKPRPGMGAPRMPGSQAMVKRAKALAEGVALHASIPPSLAKLAERYSLAPPVQSGSGS